MIQTNTRKPAKDRLLVTGLSLVALVAACLLSARPAQAATDADCPGPGDVRISVSARTAQTFTTRNSGRLTGAEAVVANGSGGGDYTLEIHEVDASGVPTNTVLASATVPDSAVPDNAVLTTVSGDFSSPTEVEARQEYALVVLGPAGFSVGARTNDPCPGERFTSFSQSGPFFQSGAEDLVFATYVDPFEPFTVNSRDDFADKNVGDGRCDVDLFRQGDQCTLRAAIEEANTTAFADTVGFDIAGTGVQTIEVGSGGLPQISESLTIDGYTQRGASENTLEVGNDAVLQIELDGTGAGAASGLDITASNSVVKGLAIDSFQRGGIFVHGSSPTDATNNRIEGNFVGTDPTGLEDRGNGDGVFIAAPDNTVGGDSPAARNLVSGNGFGVVMGGSRARNNEVLGNYVGTDRNGTGASGNAGSGVLINNASGNTVGGTNAGARNVISGNGFSGINILNAGATENEVLGNFIGTGASGTEDLGNSSSGVIVELASNNAVGGTAPGSRNVISGNEGVGVVLIRAAANNEVLGNLIGTNADGSGDLGNSGSGVFIGFDNASNNTVGGISPESHNTIAFNGADGVTVVSAEATGNRISGNSIFSNGDIGMDLNDDGPTANDPGDLDAGPNNLQNFPVFDSARTKKKATTVKGTLESVPNQTFTVQLFRDPQGEDEGKSFVGETSVTIDADGVASFSFKLKGAQKVPKGEAVTATATDPDGNTSEFSAAKEVRRR